MNQKAPNGKRALLPEFLLELGFGLTIGAI